jgi:DNA-binding XRE family transcriptional regulator
MNYALDVTSRFLPALLVALIMFWFNKRQKVREKKHDHQQEIRRKENLLQLQMIAATADLSRATAVALKNGKANGEVDEGLTSYVAAKKCYYAFLNAQALDHIAGTR